VIKAALWLTAPGERLAAALPGPAGAHRVLVLVGLGSGLWPTSALTGEARPAAVDGMTLLGAALLTFGAIGTVIWHRWRWSRC
jgi:multicomponent K+:H+ antiporter subunit A